MELLTSHLFYRVKTDCIGLYNQWLAWMGIQSLAPQQSYLTFWCLTIVSDTRIALYFSYCYFRPKLSLTLENLWWLKFHLSLIFGHLGNSTNLNFLWKRSIYHMIVAPRYLGIFFYLMILWSVFQPIKPINLLIVNCQILVKLSWNKLPRTISVVT